MDLSQTQQESNELINDIFGDDDDDDDAAAGVALAASSTSRGRRGGSGSGAARGSAGDSDDEDDIDGDEDDDELNDSDYESEKVSANKRLKAKKQAASAAAAKKQASQLKVDIFGSDDEDEDDEEENERARKAAAKKTEKRGRKRAGAGAGAAGEAGADGEGSKKIKKRARVSRKAASASAGEGGSSSGSGAEKKARTGKAKSSGQDSGDEYDSGEEVVATKEDEAFIDDSDDQADLMDEYNQDNQDFHDDRPEDAQGSKKKGKKGKTSASTVSGGNGVKVNPNDNDIFSQTILSMKKKKPVQLSDSDKNRYVTDLLKKMAIACKKDDELLKRGEPAVCKLQLLDTVKRSVLVSELHNSLLEGDILSRLKDWIEPKGEAGKVLPSLEVRSAVYQLLSALPCESDYLRRSGIGKTVMVLRKHRDETPENKKVLKDLVERWCRPIFGKTVDPRSIGQRESSDELKSAAAMQSLSTMSQRKDAVHIDRLISDDKAPGENDFRQRVRTPFTNGYVFTVRPEGKEIEKREPADDKQLTSRSKLLKMMKERRGPRDDVRALHVDLSGRDKKI